MEKRGAYFLFRNVFVRSCAYQDFIQLYGKKKEKHILFFAGISLLLPKDPLQNVVIFFRWRMPLMRFIYKLIDESPRALSFENKPFAPPKERVVSVFFVNRCWLESVIGLALAVAQIQRHL